MTIVEALTNLYISLGGSLTDIPNNATSAELVNLCASLSAALVARVAALEGA